MPKFGHIMSRLRAVIIVKPIEETALVTMERKKLSMDALLKNLEIF